MIKHFVVAVQIPKVKKSRMERYGLAVLHASITRTLHVISFTKTREYIDL